jgi:hypothetical protein
MPLSVSLAGSSGPVLSVMTPHCAVRRAGACGRWRAAVRCCRLGACPLLGRPGLITGRQPAHRTSRIASDDALSSEGVRSVIDASEVVGT